MEHPRAAFQERAVPEDSASVCGAAGQRVRHSDHRTRLVRPALRRQRDGKVICRSRVSAITPQSLAVGDLGFMPLAHFQSDEPRDSRCRATLRVQQKRCAGRFRSTVDVAAREFRDDHVAQICLLRGRTTSVSLLHSIVATRGAGGCV